MKAKPTDFLTIDKHADPLENFFKNFINQEPFTSRILCRYSWYVGQDTYNRWKRVGEISCQPARFFESTERTIKKEVINEKNVDVQTTTEEKTTEQQTEFKQFETNPIPENEYLKYGIKPENI